MDKTFAFFCWRLHNENFLSAGRRFKTCLPGQGSAVSQIRCLQKIKMIIQQQQPKILVSILIGFYSSKTSKPGAKYNLAKLLTLGTNPVKNRELL